MDTGTGSGRRCPPHASSGQRTAARRPGQGDPDAAV